MAQNLLGVVSTLVVGRLGDAALAGVGVAGALFSILLALLFGVDAGVQTVVALRLGGGDASGAGRALRRGLIVCFGLGVLLAAVIFAAAPTLLGLALHDSAAALAGTRYLQGFAPILPILGLNMTFSAYWYGASRPGRALAVTLLQAPVHVLLVWSLTLGGAGLPALGVFGAGLGATLAAGAALGLHLILASLIAPPPGLWSPAVRRGGEIGVFLRIGLPISLQQSLQYVALVLAFAVIARIGTAAAAAANAINTLGLGAALAAGGVGTAAASLVGAAVGRGDRADAARWGWLSAGFGVVILAPFCLALALWPEPALRLFLTNPATVRLATWPARLLALSLPFSSLVVLLGYALRGAGSTLAASAVSFVRQWFAELPLSWWLGVTLGFGLTGVIGVLLGCYVVGAAMMAWLWRRWSSAASGRPSFQVAAPARRVVILGGAGAGKSTLARALGDRLGLPVVHLDRLCYGPNWTRVGADAFRARIAEALAGSDWIVEGTYHEASEISLPRADLVVWLDRPAALRLWRAWRKVRLHRGLPRADRPDGCEEGFSLHYALVIFAFGGWTRAVETSLRRVAASARIVRLRSDREAQALVEAVAG